MQDYKKNMQPVINNLTTGYEIPTGKCEKQFGVFEDVLGSYSPGKHLTEVRVSTPSRCLANCCRTSVPET